MNKEQRKAAFDAVDRATELSMVVLALMIIPCVVGPMVLDLSQSAESALVAVSWFIWAAFALELVTKTYLAPARLHYLRNHWFDVLLVVLPFLRPLRVVRSTRALRALRLGRVIAAGARITHSLRVLLDSHGLKYVLLLAGCVIVLSAGLVTLVEANSGGSIEGFDDGLWWAATTVTTVGYGDTFPVTPEGRAIGVVLMIGGITLFSILTANIAAFLVKPTGNRAEDVLLEEVRRLQDQLQDQLTELKGLISENFEAGSPESNPPNVLDLAGSVESASASKT